jgi:hypothetical protein
MNSMATSGYSGATVEATCMDVVGSSFFEQV